ncbi:pilus assembly protein TadG-related protein [Streptomyces melanogenes]|uniref:pilus assembly protein TadG-related protein n=1 Tax=Streptomyces melanogenes TaxID=67326 RepID=UPI003796D4D4
MTSRRLRGDRGQAFPVYITVVAGLLFLAFAYFAVGQAAVKRNEAGTAADAAALAAAQDYRDRLRDKLLDGFDPVVWKDVLDGLRGGSAAASCAAADTLAARNDASVESCVPGDWPGYTVSVRTNATAGKSVIAATENSKGTAKATAVIEPRCAIEPSDAPQTSAPPDTGSPSPDPSSSPGGEDKKAYRLVCDKQRDFEVDPGRLDLLPDAADLFAVHLAKK